MVAAFSRFWSVSKKYLISVFTGTSAALELAPHLGQNVKGRRGPDAVLIQEIPYNLKTTIKKV